MMSSAPKILSRDQVNAKISPPKTAAKQRQKYHADGSMPLYLTEWGGLFLQWIAAVRAGRGGGGNLLFAFRACVDCHKDTSI